MGTEIDRIEIVIEAEANKASKSLDKIVSQLGKVSSALTATNTSGLRNFSSGIKQLGKSMEKISSVKTTDFNRLAKGIEKLGSINNSAIYKAGNSVRNFANSLNGINSVSDDAVKLSEIANGISKLGGARIERVVTTLPQLSVALKEFFTTLSTAPNVSENIIRMTNAMSSLASNGSKFSSTVNGLNRAAKTLTRSNNEVAVSTGKVGKVHKDATPHVASLTSQVNKLIGAYFTLKYVLGGIGESIKKSMDFNETINLFQTSYKKIGEEAAVKNGMDWGSKSADAYAKAFIDRAQAFNDKLTDALSLDPNTMMNYQAVFAQISSAMGLTANTAENISESFTMLGNDIASLWNIDTANAMQKLQAGLTGQVRPLRELGVDITQATLQLTAYKYGVKESVKDMSQAEKVQLRWLTIMDQSEVAFGDMAKTINSPANQIRILKQQWENLSRSIGNVFMPVIASILPYINAVVIALRNMIDTIAKAVGFELPDYSNSSIYTDVTGGIGGISDATDEAANSTDKATKANEKYKKSLMGFDELNILTDNSKDASSSKSGSGGAASGGGNSALDDAINAKTASYMKKFNEQLEAMSNKSKDLAKGITDFFDKIASDAKPTTEALKKLWDDGLSKVAGFVAQGAIDFYDKFLEPVGKWVLGKGIPGLATSLNNLLTAVDWDSLNDALSDLFDSLAKMTTGIGQGLVDFVADLTKALKPAIGVTSKLLADSIKSIAGSLKNVDTDTWHDAGYALGEIGIALAGIKIVTGLTTFLKGIGTGLTSIATGITKLQGLDVVALPALFDVLGFNDWFNDFMDSLPQWCQDLWNGFIDTITSAFKGLFNYDALLSITQSFIDTWNKVFNPGDDVWYKIAGNILLGLGKGLLIAVDLILEPINDLFMAIVNGICDVFGIHSPAKNMEPYGQYILLGILQGFTDKVSEWTSVLTTFASDTVASFTAWAGDVWDGIVTGFGDIVGWFGTKFTNAYNAIGTAFKNIGTWASGVWSSITGAFKNVGTWFSTKFSAAYSSITTSFSNLGAWAKNRYSDLTAAFSNVKDWFSTKFSNAYTSITTAFSNIGSWASKRYSDVKNGFSGIKDWFATKFGDAYGAVETAFKPFSKFFSGLGTTIKNTFWGAINSVRNTFNDFIKWINDKLTFSWKGLTIAGKKIFDGGSITLATIPTIPEIKKYAIGGFPEDGLFFANHSELVGQFSNGKTAVANNFQIQAGIEEAAYRGYMRASMQLASINSGSNTSNIIVENSIYAGDEVLYRATQRGKAKSERRFQTALNLT